jgi:hypothetical protein
MQTIYNFDDNRIYNNISREIEDHEGISTSWTFNAPPEILEGKFAYFYGPDWIILDSYPTPVPYVEQPSQDIIDRIANAKANVQQ